MTVVCSGLVDGFIYSSAKSLFLYILWVTHCTSWSPFKKLLAVQLYSVHVHQDLNSNDSNNQNQREWASKVRTHAVCCFWMSLIKLQLTQNLQRIPSSLSLLDMHIKSTQVSQPPHNTIDPQEHIYMQMVHRCLCPHLQDGFLTFRQSFWWKKGCFVKSSAGTLPFLHWRKWEGSSTISLPDMEYHIVLHTDRSGLWMQSFTNHWMKWPVIPSQSPAATTFKIQHFPLC